MTEQGIRLPRPALLEQLADAATAIRTTAPTLVAIDGRSAAGKTTLADDLAALVDARGRPVLRSSIDDFHPPGHKYRSRARGYTPESYYAEGFDYAAFRHNVLDPLRPGGDRRCRLAVWDSLHDAPIPEQWTEAAPDTVAIIDGAFLLRADLRQYWDYAIWLHIDWETMIARAARRDVAWVGSAEVVIERYRMFWVPMHTFYEAEADPTRYTNIVVDTNDFANPVITQETIA